MSDHYLWDKSGEPDPELEQLEHLLGGLRYQPRALDLPAVPRRRVLSPYLAAAAVIVVMILAAGVWMGLKRYSKATDQSQAAGRRSAGDQQKQDQSHEMAMKDSRAEPDRSGDHSMVSVRQSHHRKPRHLPAASRQPVVDSSLAAEQELAKQQLMLALRLASSKLNLAQKKVQESSHSRPQS